MAISHLPKTAGASTLIQRSRTLGGEQKAIFHNLTGAGRAHVLRPFMGLTDDDEDYLVDRISEGIDRHLAGEGSAA